MAMFFDRRTRSGVRLPDREIEELLGNGTLSDIEDLDDDEVEFRPQVFDHLAENDDSSQDSGSDEPPSSPPPPLLLNQRGRGSTRRRIVRAGRSRGSRGANRSALSSVISNTQYLLSFITSTPANADLRKPRKRTWKEVSFEDKSHQYPSLPIKRVRTPVEYFHDYFDDQFITNVAQCTNLYYLRKTGKELKTTSVEISKLFGIHIIMGCIPYPRLPMYRAGTNLDLVCNVMSRDRFLSVRNALHVVDADFPAEAEKDNPLWKVQTVLTTVQNACNRLERVPGFYSIDEQMIPFTGRSALRQVVKNKPRPVGLKNFVLTTSDGLMLDFDIYRGAKTMFSETNLGLGPSVILHLSKSIPPGSCVYHDRYFTTVPLLEEMGKLGLHSTGTIMQNRIPDRASIKFKQDKVMERGESQQFVCPPVTVVKWKDNKSVLMSSNCTGSGVSVKVKRWEKSCKVYKDVTAPKIVENYNQHMGGVDVLDQSMEYYRTFIKTKKWTLKVMIHFLDLVCVNSWRLYKNECCVNGFQRKDIMPLLDFRMSVADTLTNIPERERVEISDEDSPHAPRRDYKIYRPATGPSEAKRYDGYDHIPIFDDIKAPRTCRKEGCGSRTKIKCEKCDVYLCLSRGKDCFKLYHKK